MSKRQFKSQASSGRAGNTFGGFGSSGFGTGQSSVLSFVQEPPDYSSINDANTVVSLKNLSKKDSTTKAKALEDLQSYVGQSETEISEPFLEVWVKLFPRLSIDNARRVRQLAYSLNGQICSKSGKRTAKHMPKIAGPWLAGTFDNDRATARAATDALNLVFSTAEKLQGVRRTFQRSIVEYCRDAILHESVQSLSDEKVVSSDDAIAVYARVVATSISVIGSLIKELKTEDRYKEISVYEEIFREAKLWEKVYMSDAGARRSMHRMIQITLEEQPDLVKSNIGLASHAYIYKGLCSDQKGSALDLLQTLEVLTRSFPTLWTEQYSEKKSAESRLCQFLKQGSQSATAEFWDSLSRLLKVIPSQIFPKTTEEATALLSSARAGISKKEERFNLTSAWPAYFALVDVVAALVPEADMEPVLSDQALPVVRQYLFPSSDTIEWSITGAKAAWTVSRTALVRSIAPLLAREWPQFGDSVIEVARLSQPEQSKDFDQSQRHVASTGERWANLQKELWEGVTDRQLDVFCEPFATTNTKILIESISLLKARNGKPYGAAAVIEQLLRTCGNRLIPVDSFRSAYTEFVENDMPGLMFSPSQRQLIHGLYAVSSQSFFASGFSDILHGLLNADVTEEAKWATMRQIFTQNIPTEAAEIARDTPEFQKFLQEYIDAEKAEGTATLFAELVKLQAVSSDTIDQVMAGMIASLNSEDRNAGGLPALESLTRDSESTVRSFMTKSDRGGDHLLPALLQLEQSPDDNTAERAASLSSRLSSAVSETALDKRFSVVLRNLEEVSEASLSIEAVQDLTSRLLGAERTIDNAMDLLPSLDIWRSALYSTMQEPKASLALLSSLGGGVYLVNNTVPGQEHSVRYDAEGLSQALRIAMYISRLLSESDLLDRLNDLRSTILALLEVSVLVAEDNISIFGANRFWKGIDIQETESVVLDFIKETYNVLRTYWKSFELDLGPTGATKSSQMFEALEMLGKDGGNSSALSYYVALTSAQLRANLFDLHGFSNDDIKMAETNLGDQKSADNRLQLLSCIVGFQQPLNGTQMVNRLCNELITDLTDLDVGDEDRSLEKMALLDVILRTQEGLIDRVAKQRIIFLVKRLVSWFGMSASDRVKSEILRVLAKLLPAIEDMYGEHWEQTLSSIIDSWATCAKQMESRVIDEDAVLLMNASLRLYGGLRGLSNSNEANDDLVETLNEKKDLVHDGLIHLLLSNGSTNDDFHQPLLVTHELLARQITALPQKPSQSLDDLYPLMYASSRPIQQAAFNLLHNQIPVAQEQISFDAALDNKTAHLPDELLSLILEAPTVESLADASFERFMPASLQGFLFSWRLLFNHFNGSSYRVKSDYIETLKDGTYLSGLLGLVFDLLGHTRGRPVDVAKFDIQEYTSDVEPSPEKDVQWLLTHLYFLALTHLPSLVKSYYLDIRSRQTVLVVETWTAKHISPLIIDASLRAVSEWSEKNKENPDYEDMTVKVGMRSREINVSYVVDEQTMAMKVILPECFPLASVQVQGVSRVAVKEEKWQSWLRNCQGVITFSVSV